VEYAAVHYQWTAAQTKSGKVKAVWAGGGRAPLYGKRAEAALRAKEGKPAEKPNTKQMLVDRKKAAEPGRETARQEWQRALTSGVNSEQLPHLVEHLHNLTRNELREMVRGLEQKVGGLKTDLVQRLVDHASSRPTPDQVDMGMGAMDQGKTGPLPRQREDRPDPAIAEAEARNAVDQGRKAKGKAKSKKIAMTPNEIDQGYVANFDLSKLDTPSKQELERIEGVSLQSNKNEPVIVMKNDAGDYKILDGYGRISGLRNAGKTSVHAIIIKPEDLPDGWKSIADDNDTIAELHYKYRPESHLAKPGGSASSGVYYNTFDDAISHGEYDPIYPFMVNKDAWVKERVENDGYTEEQANKEHEDDVEDTLRNNPKLLHRFIKSQHIKDQGQKAKQKPAESPKAPINPDTDLPGFAKAVQHLADTAPYEHRYGDKKAFIGDIYKRSQESGAVPKMSLDQFKQHLLKAGNAMHLRLSQQDDPNIVPRDKFEASRTDHPVGGAFHHVLRSDADKYDGDELLKAREAQQKAWGETDKAKK
jgi:hypothetical protein